VAEMHIFLSEVDDWEVDHVYSSQSVAWQRFSQLVSWWYAKSVDWLTPGTTCTPLVT